MKLWSRVREAVKKQLEYPCEGHSGSDCETSGCSGQDIEGVRPSELQIKKRLGCGAYAECMAVVVKRAGLPAEVMCSKQMLRGTHKDKRALKDFEREMQILRVVQHPNIVGYRGSGSAHFNCLLLEYVPGGDLRSLILKQMLDPKRMLYTNADALRWARQLASALDYLHSHSPAVIHRDVQPQNILLTSSNPADADIKLADFGLHKAIDCTDSNSSGKLEEAGAKAPPCRSHSPRYLMTGETGAFMYMSPEMVRSKPYGTATDIFALGLVIYELFSRYLRGVEISAVNRETVQGHALKVANGHRPAIPDTVPSSVASLISRCWDEDQDLRPTAGEVLADLNEMEKAMRRDLEASARVLAHASMGPPALARLSMPSFKLSRRTTSALP